MSDSKSPEDLSHKDIARFVPHMVDTGMFYSHAGNGAATVELPYRDCWLGDAERQLIHSSALITIIDGACGGAVFASMAERRPIATLDLRCDYLRPAVAGLPVIADAEVHKKTEQISFVRAVAHQGNPDRPVATSVAAFMVGTPARRRSGSSEKPKAEMATTENNEAVSHLHQPVFERVPYAAFLGMRIEEHADGLRYRLPFAQRLIGNAALPAIHGGVVAGFMENAALIELIVGEQTSRVPKPIDYSIDYLRSAGPSEIHARCVVNRLGARVAQVQVTAWQDDPARPIAISRAHLLMDPDLR